MNVKIYTRPSCKWCKKLKEWLKKHKVKYEEQDVSESQSGQQRDEMLGKSGQMAVPVTIINEETVIVGYDEEELAKALGKK